MCRSWAFLATLPFVLTASAQTAQVASQSDPQAILLANQATLALAGTTTVTDATLTGSARWIAGSTDETGTATLQAKGNLLARVDLLLPSGGRSQVRNGTARVPGGQWSGSDGTVHQAAQHNCWPDAPWFFPALSSLSQTSNSAFVFTYVGDTTVAGNPVHHIRISRSLAPDSGRVISRLEMLSVVDYYLDATTSLPVALIFNQHPDNDELVDISVSVLFSVYRPVNGLQVPFRVQKFINGGLALDVTVSSVAVNTGLAGQQFTLP